MQSILYARASKDRAGEEAAVERQEHDGRALAALRGWTITRMIRENDTSARGDGDREGFRAVLAAVRAGQAGAVIAWDMTRLLRSARDRLEMLEAGKAAGATLAFVRGSDLDLSKPAGRFVGDMLGAIALHEIEQKSDRQVRANLAAVAAGEPPQRRAFGFAGTCQRPGTKGLSVQVDPEVVDAEAAAVRVAYSSLIAGGSISEIARDLKATGLTTTRGGDWERGKVRAMLANPRYGGLRSYRGSIVGAGNWAGLIPEDVWRTAQTILSRPERKTNHHPTTARIHLLAGIALCGVCGDGTTCRTSYRDHGVRIYRCRKSAHLGRTAQPIDDWVTATILEWASTDEAMSYIRVADGPAGGWDLAQEAAVLTKRLVQLTEAFAVGEQSIEQLTAGTALLREQLTKVTVEADRVSSAHAVAPLVGPDPWPVWSRMSLDRRRRAIADIVTVTLQPRMDGRPLSSRWDPATVAIERR